MNETIDSTTYDSYHTAFKNAGGTKRVGGFNRNLSLSRWLAFANDGDTMHDADDVGATVPANSKWPGAPVNWAAGD